MEKGKEYILKMIVGGLICVFSIAMLGTKTIAYFTTYASADGAILLPNYILKTKVVKKDNGKTKNIIIQNTGTAPCFVRVKICVPSKKSYNIKSDTGKWKKGEDGYLYYNEVLVDNTKQTENLVIEIEGYTAESFNCAVIGEATIAMYNEEGVAYADWDREGDIRE